MHVSLTHVKIYSILNHLIMESCQQWWNNLLLIQIYGLLLITGLVILITGWMDNGRL